MKNSNHMYSLYSAYDEFEVCMSFVCLKFSIQHEKIDAHEKRLIAVIYSLEQHILIFISCTWSYF